MAETPHRIFPHGGFEEIAPGLYRVVGSLPMPLKRNMFVYRLPDGTLLIYSAVALDDAGLAALENLGRPAVMVIPHPFHIMDAVFYAKRYPQLRVVGLPDAQARLVDVKIGASPEDALPPLGITPYRVAGLKHGEVALELAIGERAEGASAGSVGRQPGGVSIGERAEGPSAGSVGRQPGGVPIGTGKALLFTDAVGQNEPPTAFLMKLLGPPGGAGVARIVKFRQVADKAALRNFLTERAATPGLKLVAGCHGAVVTQDVAGWLRRAAAGL